MRQEHWMAIEHPAEVDAAVDPIGKLHDFSAIKAVISADWVHRGLAITACVLSIISIFTGYWLALPRRQAPRRARSTEPMSIR